MAFVKHCDLFNFPPLIDNPAPGMVAFIILSKERQ